MSDQARRHQEFSDNFAAVLDSTTDWQAPTPVPEWQAQDVVDHLLAWFPSVLRQWAGIVLESDETQTWSQAWRRRSDDVQRLLEDEMFASQVITEGPFAGQPLAVAIDRIYTADIYMHTWDLARAGDIEPPMDPAVADEMLPGMQEMDEVLRDSGQFGPAVETDSDDAIDQLMAFIGRDPNWESPRA